jgi:hypothetical protein
MAANEINDIILAIVIPAWIGFTYFYVNRRVKRIRRAD